MREWTEARDLHQISSPITYFLRQGPSPNLSSLAGHQASETLISPRPDPDAIVTHFWAWLFGFVTRPGPHASPATHYWLSHPLSPWLWFSPQIWRGFSADRSSLHKFTISWPLMLNYHKQQSAGILSTPWAAFPNLGLCCTVKNYRDFILFSVWMSRPLYHHDKDTTFRGFVSGVSECRGDSSWFRKLHGYLPVSLWVTSSQNQCLMRAKDDGWGAP